MSFKKSCVLSIALIICIETELKTINTAKLDSRFPGLIEHSFRFRVQGLYAPALARNL
jgi:hypothetical protein